MYTSTKYIVKARDGGQRHKRGYTSIIMTSHIVVKHIPQCSQGPRVAFLFLIFIGTYVVVIDPHLHGKSLQ